jgi:hypothetical protein
MFKLLSEFGKRLKNVFGSCCHILNAMFCKYSQAHNQVIHIRFIKSLECRMAGKHIALCHILHLKGALQLLIVSQAFQD